MVNQNIFKKELRFSNLTIHLRTGDGWPRVLGWSSRCIQCPSFPKNLVQGSMNPTEQTPYGAINIFLHNLIQKMMHFIWFGISVQQFTSSTILTHKKTNSYIFIYALFLCFPSHHTILALYRWIWRCPPESTIFGFHKRKITDNIPANLMEADFENGGVGCLKFGCPILDRS